MLRLAFDFIIAWREIRARPNAYNKRIFSLLIGNTFPQYMGQEEYVLP